MSYFYIFRKLFDDIFYLLVIVRKNIQRTKFNKSRIRLVIKYKNGKLNISKINDFNTELRGEITLVISQKFENESENKLKEQDKKKIKKLMKKLSIKDIVTEIKKNKDVPKKEIYNYYLQLKNEK